MIVDSLVQILARVTMWRWPSKWPLMSVGLCLRLNVNIFFVLLHCIKYFYALSLCILTAYYILIYWLVFTARRYASAVYAVAVSVRLSLRGRYCITRSSAISGRPARRSVLVEMLSYCCTNNARRSPISLTALSATAIWRWFVISRLTVRRSDQANRLGLFKSTYICWYRTQGYNIRLW